MRNARRVFKMLQFSHRLVEEILGKRYHNESGLAVARRQRGECSLKRFSLGGLTVIVILLGLTVRRRLKIPRSHVLSPVENRILTHPCIYVPTVFFPPPFFTSLICDINEWYPDEIVLPSIEPSFRVRRSVTYDCNL